MCDPVLFGTAATTAVAPATATFPILGSAAAASSAATGVGMAIPATSGLFGSAGAFGIGQTLQTIGTASSMFSSYYSGQIQSANMRHQARIADYNRQVAENNAIMAQQAAEFEADRFDRQRNALMATQTTRYAKSGVVINQDTPLEVAADTSSEAAVERLAILYRGNTQANADRAQAAGFDMQSNFARINAGAAKTAGYINAASNVAPIGQRLGLLT